MDVCICGYEYGYPSIPLDQRIVVRACVCVSQTLWLTERRPIFMSQWNITKTDHIVDDKGSLNIFKKIKNYTGHIL